MMNYFEDFLEPVLIHSMLWSTVIQYYTIQFYLFHSKGFVHWVTLVSIIQFLAPLLLETNEWRRGGLALRSSPAIAVPRCSHRAHKVHHRIPVWVSLLWGQRVRKSLFVVLAKAQTESKIKQQQKACHTKFSGSPLLGRMKDSYFFSKFQCYLCSSLLFL